MASIDAQAAGQLSGLLETARTMRALMMTYDPLVTTRATPKPTINAMIEHEPVPEGAAMLPPLP